MSLGDRERCGAVEPEHLRGGDDADSLFLTRVGDVLDYTDEWGNGGRSVVTYLKKNAELRVAHEPASGAYMCQGKLILTTTGEGTKGFASSSPSP